MHLNPLGISHNAIKKTKATLAGFHDEKACSSHMCEPTGDCRANVKPLHLLSGGTKERAGLGIEPRTSRTLSENHATRPHSHGQTMSKKRIMDRGPIDKASSHREH